LSGSSSAFEAYEASFHQDLNGDGVIGVRSALSFLSATSAISISLATGAAGGGAQGANLAGVENVVGSSFDDTLIGDANGNVLDGGEGNDILQGGGGNDTLIGGPGFDHYGFNRGGGQDHIINGVASNAGASGELDFGSSIARSQLWFERSNNDLSILILGTQDRVTIDGWYSSNTSQLSEIKLSDGSMIDSQISQLVQAMASYSAGNPAFNPVSASQTPNDPALQNTIAAAWHS
jgi:Ca2+-binding RTX toxin-like protein